MDNSFAAAGDDYARGFIWSYQEYDWMGRVTRKVNTDGDPQEDNDSDILISYEGCGCAGGLVTTVQGERVPIPGSENFARRKQKSYADILGRMFKAETYEWNGSTVYSTVVSSFKGRDQVARSRHYSGSTASGTYQDTTATFDGHGRLYQSHRPEQRDSSNNLKYTTYNYNPDDSILSVTDGRGAVTNLEYNSRGLLTEKSWTVPGGSGITDPADVTFGYDNLGNRISMTDGLGSVEYEYDSLSRLTAETRQFSDTLTDAPLSNNRFKLQYAYHISGILKTMTDPYGDSISYNLDKAGRLSSVTGSSFGGVTTYAENSAYRAWGSIKTMEYGNGVEMSMTFDNRLLPSQFDLVKDTTEVMSKSYEYYRDGRLKYVEDGLNGIFDRLNLYDHQGRIKEGKSGAEARGQTVDTEDMDTELPYRQSYEFNAFNGMTQRNNLHWGKDSLPYSGSFNLNYTYENNRITNTSWLYDADGRVKQSSIPDQWGEYTYDARGLLTRIYAGSNIVDTRPSYDGDGREGKRERTVWVDDPINYPQSPWGYWDEQDDEFSIRSTLFNGQTVTEAGPTGKKLRTFVFAFGTKVATQTEHVYESTTYKNVSFNLSDASGLSQRAALSNGFVQSSGLNYDGAPIETDPMGGNVGTETPYVEEPPAPPEPAPDFPAFSVTEIDPPFVNGQRATMTLNGMLVPYSVGMSLIGHSAAVECNRMAGWFTSSEPGQGGRLYGINSCYDTMAFAQHGIYRYASTPVNDVPGRDEYMFASDKRLLTKKETDKLEADLRKGLSSEKCKNFVEGVLKGLGNSIKEDIVGIFKDFVAAKGVYDDPNMTGLGHASTTADAPNPSFEVNLEANSNAGPNELFITLLHELIHAAQKGGKVYSHTSMARRGYEVGVRLKIIPNDPPNERKFAPKAGFVLGDPLRELEMDRIHSRQFDVYLKNACDPSVEEWNDFGQFK